MEREDIEKRILLLDLDKKIHEQKERLKPVLLSPSKIITLCSVVVAIISVIVGIRTGAYEKALTEKEISTVNLEKQYAENELKKVIEDVGIARKEKDRLSQMAKKLNETIKGLNQDIESKKEKIGELKEQEKALGDEITKLEKAREAAIKQIQPTQ